MLQPLITLIGGHVSSFTLQVSGTPEETTVVLSPVLSAPAGAITSKGYNEDDHRFRALLSAPLVVSAPVGEIDTALAHCIQQYAQQFNSAVTSPAVTSLLDQAVASAAETQKTKAAQEAKAKGKGSGTSKAATKTDQHQDDSAADEQEAQQSPAAEATGQKAGGAYSLDLLASLGLEG